MATLEAHPLRWLALVFLSSLLLVLLMGCGGDSSPASPPPPEPAPTPVPPAGARDRLTVAELFDGPPPGVVHNAYYQPVGDAGSAVAVCGTLRFSETRMETPHPDATWAGPGHTLFPAFSLPVAVHGDWLVPLERGLILSGRGAGGSGDSFWNVIANPGRAWSEAGDGGYSRAAFPLTFTDNYVGQARNALLSFVYDEGAVSPAAMQITQETSPNEEYLRADFSGWIPVTFDPACPAGTERVLAEFERELGSRIPLRPWSALPQAAQSQATLRNGFADTDLSAAALLLDGQLYQQEVATRSGPHPFPEWMRHGVYSVTKTMGLGLSMFSLAERYGDGVFEERITDHVPELAAHPGWQGVTFHHALNMVTGVVGGERGARIGPFVQARSATARLAAIAALPDAPDPPGAGFDYASTHSFVLSQAMNNYVRAREGGAADYWTMVGEEVLVPLGIPHLPVQRSFEPDGGLGTPIMGWGSYPDVDAAAKVAQLLQDEGAHGGRQLLSRAKVREALRRTGVRAYPTRTSSEEYLHSVWTVRTDTGSCTIDVPLMSGYGGNHVLMMPSGVSVVRFMDAGDYEVVHALRAAEMYRSSCR